MELPWSSTYLEESEVVKTSRGVRWSLASLNSTMMSLRGNYKRFHITSATFPLCFQSHVLDLFTFVFITLLHYLIYLGHMPNAH